MRLRGRIFHVGAVSGWMVASLCAAPAPQPMAWPSGAWDTATPESVGLPSARLKETLETVRQSGWRVDSIQVVRHGKLVLDAYFYPYSSGLLHDLRSATKSVTSSLVGLSIAEGKWPGVEVTVLSQFPERKIEALDARKKAMTIGNLVDMRSGLAWTERYDGNEKSSFVQMVRTRDWIGFVLNQPMSEVPGSRFNYSGGNMNLLSAMIGQRWHQSAREVARDRLFQPLGIQHFSWDSIDPAGNTIGESTLYLMPLDMARLGLLWLRDGVWQDKRILPKGWTGQLLADALPALKDGDDYKRGFWIGPRSRVFGALGRHGQVIVVDPALDMVLVVTGKTGDRERNPAYKLVNQIRQLASEDASLPENPAAQAELKTTLQQVGLPVPEAVRPDQTPALPFGRTWTVEKNPLSIASVRFLPDPADAGAILLELGLASGVTLRWPCGVDGAYRFKQDDESGGGIRALKGTWSGPATLEIETQLLESSMYERYRIEFRAHGLEVAFANNEYAEATLHAVPR